MPNPGDAEERRNAFSVRVQDFKEFTIKASHKIHPTDGCELDLHADMIVGGANCILLKRVEKLQMCTPFPTKENHFQMYPLAQLLQHG
jgi:hypothetical protein